MEIERIIVKWFDKEIELVASELDKLLNEMTK
jgi:hypothetical protein